MYELKYIALLEQFLIRKTLYNAYKKWSKNIEIDIEEYNKMKEADPEFYREASSLQYGKVSVLIEEIMCFWLKWFNLEKVE